MFIWDFLLGYVMDQIIDWFYGQLVGFLADFFAQMGNMEDYDGDRWMVLGDVQMLISVSLFDRVHMI